MFLMNFEMHGHVYLKDNQVITSQLDGLVNTSQP